MANKNLTAAKKAKNDEFYTQLSDIERELCHYKHHFKDKVVLCNCDDPTWSNFWRYFHLNFAHFGLKKLIATHYDAEKSTYKMEYTGGDDLNTDAGIRTDLMQNGDFRSPECVAILQEADIVVTNPPFSLFREYVAQLMEYDKKFVIIGSMSAITYKDVFPLLRDGNLRLGYNAGNGVMKFSTRIIDNVKISSDTEDKPTYWYTNLDLDKFHEPLVLTKNYYGNEDRYLKYDNYDAIDCKYVDDIPKDYFGKIGVPITYLMHHYADQFDIIGFGKGALAKSIGVEKNYRGRTDLACTTSDGKHTCPYGRVIIQRKSISQED